MSELYLRIIRKGKYSFICLFVHKWIVNENTGKTIYSYCDRCHATKIEQHGEGYQPIDLKFLDRKII